MKLLSQKMLDKDFSFNYFLNSPVQSFILQSLYIYEECAMQMCHYLSEG